MHRVIAALLFLGAVAEAANLAQTCPGAAFKRSCVRKLYRCFDGAGACTRDLSRFFTAGTVTDCWANGASARLDGFGSASGVSRLVTRKGRTCLEGSTVWDAGFGVAIRYQRGKRVWRIARTVDGTFDVICPNGRSEHYAPADVTAGGCGPIADCPGGACP